MYRERLLTSAIRELSRSFSVLMLTGARQAGKTTLLRHMGPKRRFATLDDLELRGLAKEDPRSFLERFPPPAFIDEFQYAPGILSGIKVVVDEKRTRLKPAGGMYWLSGSQNFLLMKGVQESLAGRVAILELSGLSLAEIEAAKGGFRPRPFFEMREPDFSTARDIQSLFKVILRGDKPELWAKAVDRDRFYSSYIQTYLERDVMSQLGVRQLTLFDKFIRLAAARAGQLLNMANLANDLGISIPTVKEWLAVLERSDQIMLLQPYFSNIGKRLVKTPKLYFLDTGLLSHLVKWSDPSTALAGPMAGTLFENWAVSEIVKSYRHRGIRPSLYFWRTRDGQELDLVCERGGKFRVAEIKLRSMVQGDVPALSRLVRSLPIPVEETRIVCASKRNYRLQGVDIVSAWSIG